MLRSMERSTIQYLKKKGWTNAQIADFTGHHRDTIARVLNEAVDKKAQPRERKSAISVYDAQIEQCMPPVFIQRLITRLVGDDLTSVLCRTAQRERKLLHYLMVDNISTLCLVGWRTVFPGPAHIGYRYMEHSRLPLHLFWLYYPLHPLLALRTYFRARSNKKSSHR